MRKIVILAAALIAVQGCKPYGQTPATPAPTTPLATSTAASSDHALQTLRDLGVTPEVMLQLVRNQLATATNMAASAQPLPAPIAEQPTEATTPPSPEQPAEAATPPSPEQPAEAATPPPTPAAELPPAAAPGQPAAAANTIVIEQPVVVQQTQDFHAPLNSYGTWMELPSYGRVWQPTVTIVNVDWRPYCHGGRWVFTDCGWYWQSDYSWGWAPFHYGRWCYVDRHRWIWLPDTVWAPAWVSWRRSATHCGWAPLPPGTTFRAGVGFSFGHDTPFDVQFGLSSRHYTFVANSQFGDRNVASVILSASHVDIAYRGSTHIEASHLWDSRDRRVHNKGPDREGSERIIRPPARPVRIVTAPAAPASPAAPTAPVVRHPGPTVPAVPATPVTPPAAPIVRHPRPSAPGAPVAAPPAAPIVPPQITLPVEPARPDVRPVAPRTEEKEKREKKTVNPEKTREILDDRDPKRVRMPSPHMPDTRTPALLPVAPREAAPPAAAGIKPAVQPAAPAIRRTEAASPRAEPTKKSSGHGSSDKTRTDNEDA